MTNPYNKGTTIKCTVTLQKSWGRLLGIQQEPKWDVYVICDCCLIFAQAPPISLQRHILFRDVSSKTFSLQRHILFRDISSKTFSLQRILFKDIFSLETYSLQRYIFKDTFSLESQLTLEHLHNSQMVKAQGVTLNTKLLL